MQHKCFFFWFITSKNNKSKMHICALNTKLSPQIIKINCEQIGLYFRYVIIIEKLKK